jgi:hypothetical protein
MRFTMFAIAVLLAVGGCAKPPEGEGVASAGSGAGVSAQQSADPNKPSDNPEERVRQFVSCMRANGIDMPDPEPGDTTGKSALRLEAMGADKAKIAPAMEKCRHFMPVGGENVRLTPEQLENARRFAQCMRDNGAPTWPDPDADGNFKADNLAELNRNDPGVRAAIEKCRAVR